MSESYLCHEPYLQQIIINLQSPSDSILCKLDSLTPETFATVKLPATGATSRSLYLEAKKTIFSPELIDIKKDGSVKINTKVISNTRIYIIGHGKPGCDKLTGDNDTELSYTELKNMISKCLTNSDKNIKLRISLIACFGGVSKDKEKSFAYKLYDALQQYIEKECPNITLEIVARMGSVARRSEIYDHRTVNGKKEINKDMVMIKNDRELYSAYDGTDTDCVFLDDSKIASKLNIQSIVKLINDKEQKETKTHTKEDYSNLLKKCKYFENMTRQEAESDHNKKIIIIRTSSQKDSFAATLKNAFSVVHILINIDDKGMKTSFNNGTNEIYTSVNDLISAIENQYAFFNNISMFENCKYFKKISDKKIVEALNEKIVLRQSSQPGLYAATLKGNTFTHIRIMIDNFGYHLYRKDGEYSLTTLNELIEELEETSKILLNNSEQHSQSHSTLFRSSVTNCDSSSSNEKSSQSVRPFT